MAVSDYYSHSTYPSQGAAGSSSAARAEFEAVETGISAKLPDLTGNGSKIVALNSGGTALEAITTTGTGSGVRATSPTLTTPALGIATATKLNGITFTTSTGTFTLTNGKTLTWSNTGTISGTDGFALNVGTGGTLGTAAYTAATAYVATSNALTMAGTNGSTLTIGTGGTLGTAAYTASSSYSLLAGSSSIVTVGTVTSGTWNGSIIAGTYGGTGINNGARTITLGGNLVTSGANNVTLTTTGSTNVTLPTSGTLLGTAAVVTSTQGGTGVANNAASTITISGAYASTFTLTNTTSVTFPTTGTLATRAGSEALTNKTINGLTVTTTTGTLTLSNSSTLATSGGDSITLSSTASTNVTLPTSGTLFSTAAVIAGTYGGTGVNNGVKTITLGGNLVTSGANNVTLTSTGSTNVTLPTSGTLFSTDNINLTAPGGYVLVNHPLSPPNPEGTFSVTSLSGTSAGSFMQTGGNYVGVFHSQDTSGSNLLLAFGTEVSYFERGTITFNRGGGLIAYNTTSDYRSKTVNGPVFNALGRVALLKPCTGRMNGAEQDIDFFVAHELAAVVPSAVTGEKDAVRPVTVKNSDGSETPTGEMAPVYQMVDKSAIIPLLTAAIQELKEMAEAQSVEIAALKAASV